MPDLTILRGMPCSGKSTYCNKALENPNYQGFSGYDPPVIISRDTIRVELFNCKYNEYKHCKENEEKVTKEFDEQFKDALEDKRNIILDNTNLRPRAYNKYMEYAKNAGYWIEFVDFYVPFWIAMIRNILRRTKTGKWIPYKIMKQFYERSKYLKNA